MIPPTTTGASTPIVAQLRRATSGTSSRCEPDRIDRPITSGSSSRADAAICSSGEADAGVDDLHAGVAGGDGDLLGAVGVAVEAGLGDEQLRRPAGASSARSSATAASSPAPAPTAPPTPVGARYSPNTSRITAPHSPVVPPALASAIDGRHDVVAVDRRPAQLVERGVDGGVVAARPPRCDVGDHLGLDGRDRRVRMCAARRRAASGSVSVNAVDADDDLLAGLDAPGALGHRRARAGPSARRPPRTRRPARARRRARPAPRRAARPSCASIDRASRRRGRRTRAGRSRTRAPVASATTTAGPTGGAGRAPRSTPAAGRCAPGPASTASRPSISSTMRCTLFSGCASVRPRLLTCTP